MEEEIYKFMDEHSDIDWEISKSNRNLVEKFNIDSYKASKYREKYHKLVVLRQLKYDKFKIDKFMDQNPQFDWNHKASRRYLKKEFNDLDEEQIEILVENYLRRNPYVRITANFAKQLKLISNWWHRNSFDAEEEPIPIRSKKKRTSYYMREDIIEEIKNYAENSGISSGDFITKLFENYKKKYK